MAFRTGWILAIILMASAVLADDYRSKSNEGYEYYKNGEYDKAVEYYRQAGILMPEEVLPKIGKGASLYRSNDLDGAAKEFESAASKGDKKVAADMQYNIGNTRYKAEDYKGAIESYVDALKANPEDLDYKHNLEMALSRLQMQQQQQQQQGDKQDKDGEQGDKGENQQNKDNKQEEQDKQDQKDANQQDQQNQDQEMKKDQAQMAEEGKMSEEEAKNLLARFEADEKEIQQQLKQVNIRGTSKNDW